jgi:iron(III) transport system ATP-binding protein
VEALALSDTIAVMRSGQIVEIGTPQKIYFDADHEFVADFIGRANLIKATVRAQDAEYTVVDCGMGRITCQHRDFPIGSEVTLCLRPEFIRLVRGEGAAGKNVVNGGIESLIFVGEAYEAEIRVGNELLLAKFDSDVNLKAGDAVSFTLDPAHCLLVSI